MAFVPDAVKKTNDGDRFQWVDEFTPGRTVAGRIGKTGLKGVNEETQGVWGRGAILHNALIRQTWLLCVWALWGLFYKMVLCKIVMVF